MTADEADMIAHLRANRRLGSDRAEVIRQAEWYAKEDPYRLSRLPALLKAEIEKHAAKQIPSTAN